MNPVALFDDARAALRVRATRLTRRFDARPQRERIVMLLALAALSFWLADRLWITPSYQRARAASAELAGAHGELDALRADLARLKALGAEQQRSLQAEMAATRSRVASGAAALRAYEDTLVGADRMVELLEQMLPRHGRLKVRELKSLGRTDLLAPAGSAPAVPVPAAAGASVYRHGVELTLEGSYADLLEYLQALEKMPRRVLWGGMSMKVERHPKVVLTLRLYTLSLDRGWLNL
jgi:MSHA biogenesis protein MshJ